MEEQRGADSGWNPASRRSAASQPSSASEMCGISGVIGRFEGTTAATADAALEVLRALRHRGPDGEGEYRDGRLWFGHTRLCILDLSDSGRQPMATPSGRYIICHNGEAYNYRDLATELALANLRSRSDTEVILRAFEQRGVDTFRRLNGIFALAVYDKKRQKVWLARDRLGVKPLYCRLDAQGLTFASEIKAIAAIGHHSLNCDLTSLHAWLYYGNSLGGKTLYQGIVQLLPGHYLELDLASFNVEVTPYWSLKRAAGHTKAVSPSKDEMVAETRGLLELAVRRQLVSDVPVGVFLSGGIDSSAITAFATKHYRGRLNAYSADLTIRGAPTSVQRRDGSRGTLAQTITRSRSMGHRSPM